MMLRCTQQNMSQVLSSLIAYASISLTSQKDKYAETEHRHFGGRRICFFFRLAWPVVKSNFVPVDSFLMFMWASLRQALMRKLATDLLNDDHMLTIENPSRILGTDELYVIDTIGSQSSCKKRKTILSPWRFS